MVLVEIDGSNWLLDDVLDSRDDKPCISWYNGPRSKHWKMLKVID